MAPATSSRTYNFAKIISVAHLPRIFIANALIATAFTGHGKSPLTIEHIILSNKISWIGTVVKPVLRSCRTTSRFNCSQKITNRPRILWTLSNEKNTPKFAYWSHLNPILSPYLSQTDRLISVPPCPIFPKIFRNEIADWFDATHPYRYNSHFVRDKLRVDRCIVKRVHFGPDFKGRRIRDI